ncbi:MAG: TAXI family TRAP transporter solute-binding subunit [Alphaproteobacteria bacterium]|nr:MAG: TAXI family TRAP transporter solute-binding subunit [Alphaproteobacteria bacterium]
MPTRPVPWSQRLPCGAMRRPRKTSHRSRRAVGLAVMLALVLASGGGAAQAQAQAQAQETPARRVEAVIGTAPVGGTFYLAGGAVCTAFNRAQGAGGLPCLVAPSAGSADNLARLRRGEIDFAVVQSDWQYLATHDGLPDDGRPWTQLRAVFALQAQPVTVLVHPEADIAALDDLKGRRVNLGPPDSAMRVAAEGLIEALGWRRRDFEGLGELAAPDVPEALCARRIDAAIVPLSHPSRLVADAVMRCGARIVAVTGAKVRRLIADWPFYAPATIPGGLYPGIDQPVPSYGVRATLVTTATVPDATVYRLVKAVFDDLDRFKAQHAVLGGLDVEDMIGPVNTAPFHDGALRYYRERGWQK